MHGRIVMKNITKRFSSIDVLKNVSVEFAYGEVHCLLGENGAGKSTLMKILAGVHAPDSGQILKNGSELRFSSPTDAMRAGISMVHQELTKIPHMTVTENIFLGDEIARGTLVRDKEMNNIANALCNKMGLQVDVTLPMNALSAGEAQLVEIIKAVHRRADVLIFDEPTSSLSVREVEQLFELLRQLKREEKCIIYISHKLEEIFQIGDRVTTLRDGETTLVGEAISNLTKSDLVKAMVGRTLDQLYPPPLKGSSQQVVLKVKGLSKRGRFHNISFDLHEGEILGIAGLIGAGRSEAMHAIFGSSKYDDGEIYFLGRKVLIKSPKQAMELGIALIPEDRRELGIVPALPVKENVTMCALPQFTKLGLIDDHKEMEAVESIIRRLQVKIHSVLQPISSLSGGNQQKIVVGKWLLRHLKVLILDEPTRGVDVGAKYEIYTLIREIAAAGVGVIMVSSELPELLGMTDRILVFRRGEIAGEIPTERATEEDVLQLAL
ncbi:MAG: sugar ABC transporter ATP-binding protein [Alicyclobacillus sp.]|nr:sugar ABC transporter ATP-binding protein [Alicyclobacillus sp.]